MILPYKFENDFLSWYKPNKNDYFYMFPFYYDYKNNVTYKIIRRELYKEHINKIRSCIGNNIIIYVPDDNKLSEDIANYYKNELGIEYIITNNDLKRITNDLLYTEINGKCELFINWSILNFKLKDFIEKINELYYNFPKVDLHCHLDGSFNIYGLLCHSKNHNVDIKYKTEDQLLKDILKDHEDLADYLSMFDEPLKILQFKDTLTEITRQLIKESNLDYMEIRFAPQLHTKQGLTQEEVVQAVLNGITDHRKCKLILCMMRYDNADVNWKDNFETVMLADKYKDKGVCCVDLACNEPDDLLQWKPLFDLCHRLGVKTICHGGESTSYRNVDQCIEMGVSRIGHGIKSIESEETIQKLIDNNIPLEICPTSNVQCHNVESYEKHPAHELYKKGVPITINTDCLTMSQTTLEKEYNHCLNEMGFEYEDVINMARNSILYSFADEDYKNEMLEKIDRILEAYKWEKVK